MSEHEEAVTEAEEVAEETAEDVAPAEDVAVDEWTPEELAELGEEPAPEVESEPEPEAAPVVTDFYEDLKEMGIDPTEYESEYEPEPAFDPGSEEFAKFRDAFAENTEQILTTPNPLMQQVEIEIAARKQALHDRIRHDYDNHGPHSPEKIELFNNIAAQFEQLAHATIDQCPDGRDLSLALTHLEDAKRYAISAVVKG